MIIRDKEKKHHRVIICDDNSEQLEQMKIVCRETLHMADADVLVYSSGTDMYEDIRTGKFTENGIRTVVFLDIEMPGIDGVELGCQIHECMPGWVIVFITAHPEYAIKGYEARAFRYLLKPLTSEAVQGVMDDIHREYSGIHRMLLSLPGMEEPVRLDDIVYISAEDKYTMIYTRVGRITDRTSLAELEEMLREYGFFRIHRKYIVNMRYHREISKGRLILSGGEELPISRRRESVYREILMKKMEKDLEK